ncbi:MAG: hypothetical protein ACSHXK_08460 [Oceanococcus sp.]
MRIRQAMRLAYAAPLSGAVLCANLLAFPASANDSVLLGNSLQLGTVLATHSYAAVASQQLFLRAPYEKLRVRRIILLSNGKVVFDQHLQHAAAQALAQGLAMPLPGLTVSDQALQIELQFADLDAPPASPYQVERLSTSIASSDRSQFFEVTLQQGHWLPWKNGLILQALNDPLGARSDSAIFNLQTGRNFLAAAQLWSAKRRSAISWTARFALTEAQMKLGLNSSVELEALSQNAPPDIAAQAALRLAEEWQTQGDTARARRWLDRARLNLPEFAHARHMALRVQLEPELSSSQLPDSILAQGEVALATYNRAALNPSSGALALLEKLGSLPMDADDTLAWSVRDQANLALGYSHLRQRRPQQAQAAFVRVRASGPYSSAGRLGLGWSQITASGGGPGIPSNEPAAVGDSLGELLRPRGEDSTAQARRATPFRTVHGKAYGHRAEDLQYALQAWSDLIGGNPLNPAVQEAMLAIPYAMVHLGAYANARTRLQAATHELQGLQQLLAASQSVEKSERLLSILLARQENPDAWSEHIAGASWWRQNQTPEFFFLQHVLADGKVQQHMQRCNSLQEAQQYLSQFQPADPTLQQQLLEQLTQLQTASTDCRKDLASASAETLHSLQHTTQRYLSEARLALARLHDGQPDELAQALPEP